MNQKRIQDSFNGYDATPGLPGDQNDDLEDDFGDHRGKQNGIVASDSAGRMNGSTSSPFVTPSHTQQKMNLIDYGNSSTSTSDAVHTIRLPGQDKITVQNQPSSGVLNQAADVQNIIQPPQAQQQTQEQMVNCIEGIGNLTVDAEQKFQDVSQNNNNNLKGAEVEQSEQISPHESAI